MAAKQKANSYMIEYAMGHWFSKTAPKRYVYSLHQIKALIVNGYLVFDREIKHEYPHNPKDNWTELWYRPTPEGVQWWISQRALEYEGSEYVESDPAVLLEALQFKGVGSEATFYLGPWNVGAVFAALRDGFLEFLSHTDYCGMPRSASEYITVKMTPKGIQYFDSLPRLVEVW